MNNDTQVPKVSGHSSKRRKPIILIIILVLIALVVTAIALVALGVLSVESLHHLANSPVWLMVRLVLYAGLWFGWEKMVANLGGSQDGTLVRQSRRPLLVLLIVYECLFANNILTLLR